MNKQIDEIIKSRRHVCKSYNAAFQRLDGIQIPKTDFENVSPFIYVIRVLNGKRESLMNHLKNELIDTGVHWKPAHRFSYFANTKNDGLSVTNQIAEEILTLPLHPNMRSDFVERIIGGVETFFN